MKYVKLFEGFKAQQLNEKWKKKLHAVYSTKEEFLDYNETYEIAKRLGFDDPEELWKKNPTIEGGTDPNDLKIVEAELDSFGNKKEKEEKEENSGTVLSNTTGTITTAEVSEAKEIDKLDEKMVNKMYDYYLDELPNSKREAQEKKNLNIKQKREVLKKQQNDFEKSLK